MRCVLIGNYGVGNLGDELLKEYFLSRFSDIQWVVVSATPHGVHEVPRFPLGLRSLFSPWWRTIQAYRECDAVVFGGGSLFTDTESPFACVLWWWHAFVAWMLRKPFFLAFQGIGPLRTRIGTVCTRWVVRHAVFCSLRDEASAKRVEAWGVKVVRSIDPIVGQMENSTVSAPSFACHGEPDESIHARDGAETCKQWSSDTKKRLVIIPRQNSGEDFLDRVREIVRNDVWDEIVILSLQPDHRGEQRVCEQLQEEVKRATIVRVCSLEVLVREIHRASLVLSQRYHGALSAILLKKKIEIVHQAEGDKLSVMREGLSDGISALRRGEETLRSALMGVVSSL